MILCSISSHDIISFAEGLKNYPRHASTSKLQNQRMQEIEQQFANIQGLPTDRNPINKLMAMQQPGINSPNMSGNNPNMITYTRGALSGPAAAAMALTNHQNIMMRQNSMNSNMNSLQHDQASSSLNNSANPSPSSSFQPGGGFSNPQMATRSLSSNSLNHQNQPNNQQQQMIQQLLQGMSGNNVTGQQKPTFGGQNVNPTPNTTTSGLGYGQGAPSTPTASSNVPGGVGGPALSKSSSFKAAAASNSDSSAAGGGTGNSGFNNNNPKAADLPQSLCLTDDMVPDLPHDFAESGFFSSDLDDNMGYGWKA